VEVQTVKMHVFWLGLGSDRRFVHFGFNVFGSGSVWLPSIKGYICQTGCRLAKQNIMHDLFAAPQHGCIFLVAFTYAAINCRACNVCY